MNDKNGQEKRRWQALASLLFLLLVGVILIFVSAMIESHWPVLATILRDVGFVFAPVAALSLIYEYMAQKEHSQYVANQVSRDILEELDHRIGGLTGHKEVVAIYPSRQAVNLYEYFGAARQQVDILTTNLQSLEMLLGLLLDLARRGVQVRVLTLNPEHEFLRKRFKELHFREARFFRDEMVASLRHFCGDRETLLSKDEQTRFLIALFDNPPSLMLFRRDDRVILGFILQQGRARDQMHIEFDCSQRTDRSTYSRCFVEHFEILWKSATPVDSETVSGWNGHPT